MKNKTNKLLISTVLCLVLTLLFAAPTFAGSNSVVDGNYTISVTCNSKSSSHTVSGPYNSFPTGRGTIRYTYTNFLGMQVETGRDVAGTSFASYWTGNWYLGEGEFASRAFTYYDTVTISAIP